MTTSPLSERLYETGAAWLAGNAGPEATRRERAMSLEQFRRLGLPSRRDEAWRYTPHKRVFRADLRPGAAHALEAAAEILKRETAELGVEARFVFVDGRFAPSLSQGPASIDGLSLLTGDAAARDPRGLAERTRRAGHEAHGWSAFSAALAPEDLLLRVSGTLEAPVALIHVSTAEASEALVASQLLLHLEARAKASFFSLFLGRSGSSALGSHQEIVWLEEGAELEASTVISLGSGASLLLRSELELGRGASASSRQFLLSGGVLRNELRVGLGEEAQVKAYGIALAAGQGHAEHEILVHHQRPRSRSEQLYKTIASEAGHTAFSGRVIVDEGAKGAVAHQTNRNLLLSREAEVDTRPQLEIYEKEVEASHGATVGQLEDEQLFYFASRGIDAETASGLLRAAFIEETLASINARGPRRWIRGRALSALGISSPIAAFEGEFDDEG